MSSADLDGVCGDTKAYATEEADRRRESLAYSLVNCLSGKENRNELENRAYDQALQVVMEYLQAK